MSGSTQSGRYRLERRLGVGGTAEVLLATLPGPAGFSKRVVIKRLHEHLCRDEMYAQKFLNEARLLARFNHPNLIHVYELTTIEGRYCLVMEYLEGADLSDVLDRCAERGAPVPARIAASIVSQAALGLDYAHNLKDDEGVALNVIHRDITPANVILTHEGHVKVVDFGIAAFTGRESTQAGLVWGSPGYMSPEQAQSAEVDRRCDVFALGLVLYEMLTLERFHPRLEQMRLLGHIAGLVEVPPTLAAAAIDNDLRHIIRQMVEPDPARRFQSARAVSEALESYIEAGVRPTDHDLALFAAGPNDRASRRPTTRVGRDTVDVQGELANVTHTLRENEVRDLVAGLRQDEAHTVPLGPTIELSQTVPTGNTIELSQPVPTGNTVELNQTATSDQTVPSGQPGGELSQTEPDIELSQPDAPTHSSAADETLVVPRPSPGKPRHRAPGVAIALSAVAVVAAAAWFIIHFSIPTTNVPHETTRRIDPSEPRSAVPAAEEPVHTDPRANPSAAPTVEPVPPRKSAAQRAATGQLRLDSEPATTAFLQGRKLGRTPLRDTRLRPGTHQILLRNDELGIHKGVQVSIVAGRVTRQKIQIRKGKVAVHVTPWATVFVRGQNLGTTPMPPLELYEGRQQLELVNSKTGQRKTVQVRVIADETVNVSASLE